MSFILFQIVYVNKGVLVETVKLTNHYMAPWNTPPPARRQIYYSLINQCVRIIPVTYRYHKFLETSNHFNFNTGP